MFHEEVGHDGDTGLPMVVPNFYWYIVFLNVKKVVFRTKSKSVMMSSISSLALSVMVVSFCSLVLIISIVLGISVLVKRDTTSWNVKISSSCRVIDFSSTARCLEFFTWCCVIPVIGPIRLRCLYDTL